MDQCIRTTANGTVKGFFEDGVYKWLGVPYAKAPVGELRFRRAQKAEPRKGVYDATYYRAKCVQPPNFMISTDLPESEDCLYLNIWAPENAEKKPVFVWIHGGAFTTGEGSLPEYAGTGFAKNDVVYVSINYRLGAFGGYSFGQLPHGKGKFDSNCGFSDVLCALEWIKNNIAAFGGDPENITVAGESAGGTTVLALMVSPAAKGLFHKAIAESSVPENITSQELSLEYTRILLGQLGLTEDDVEKIKELDPKDLAVAAGWTSNNNFRANGKPASLPPAIVIDDLCPNMPLDVIGNGVAKDIPLLIGFNLNDSSVFLKPGQERCPCTAEEWEHFFRLNNVSKEDQERILAVYPDYPDRESMKQIATDEIFTVYTTEFADAQKEYANTWMYRFDYSTAMAKNIGLGAYHTFEISFALNTQGHGLAATLIAEDEQADVAALTKKMHGMWVNFAKYGNPNGDGVFTPWPAFDEKRKMYLFDKECNVAEDPFREARLAWGSHRFYR